MANRYVRSTDGSDADDGTTWALAKATLAGIAAIDTAGDQIFVSQSHAETTAAAITAAWAGTVASTTRIICGNDAAEPPTAVAATGTVSTTGASDITIATSGFFYLYGLTFTAGDGANLASLNLASGSGAEVFDTCNFRLGNTNASSRINLTNANNIFCRTHNCGFKFAATGQSLNQPNRSDAHVNGGSIESGSSAITLLFIPAAMSRTTFDGVDLSNGAAAMNLTSSTSNNVDCVFRNCKLPASWSGSLNASVPGLGSVYELHNCDSGDTNYRYIRQTQFGTITSEIVVVRTGGASDGVTTLSWKMVGNANTKFPQQTLESTEIVRWNETTGSAITATIEIVHDSQGSGAASAFTDAEAWLEVLYLGTSGFPLGAFVNDRAATVLTTVADQTSSSVTWTTTGLATPVKQKLSVTFTPQEKGYLHAVVHLGGVSDTCYVDPLLTIT